MPSSNDYVIIIPQHGRHALTLSCVSSLLRQGVAGEKMAVVDNGSHAADQQETVRSLPIGVKLLHESQRGITHAWNHAWRKVACEFVIFLNNDVVATGDLIPELLTPFDHPDVEIVGLARSVDRETTELYLRGGFAHQEIPRLIQGWCFAVRRSSLEKLQGFDTELGMYFSDTDLCLRTQQNSCVGVEAIYQLQALPVIHLAHRTLHSENNRRAIWKRDRERFMSKWSISHDANSTSM